MSWYFKSAQTVQIENKAFWKICPKQISSLLEEIFGNNPDQRAGIRVK
jgi:hypothetical protein